MSFGVMRGSPEEAQLYLDRVIDSMIQDGSSRAKSRELVNVAEILYYCMRTNPDAVHTINAATGQKFTNKHILKRAVSVARAVTATGGTRTAIIILRNHEHMSAVYYAVMLAGVVPFCLEPLTTEYEVRQALSLVSPCLIFCEAERYDDVINAVRSSDVKPDVVVADGPSLDKFVQGHSDDLDSFELAELQPDSSAIMLPTSGSTGVPKAAILSHQGLVVQLPVPWLNHSQFPQPTRLALLLSNAQWMTHSVIMTSCPVYQIPMLLTPEKVTAEYIAKISEKYRPTWTFSSPAMVALVGSAATSEQLSSFESIVMGGASFSPAGMAPVQEKLSPSGSLLNGYGMTETQGFVAIARPSTPLTSVGKVANIFDYKLLNENGEDVLKPFEKGEFYIKGKSIWKGYLKDEKAYNESVTSDGWMKTGDIFYSDEEGQLYFASRTKIGFKYFNHHIYPEEIEQVIGTLPGVQQCVVCGADSGPAAAVVLMPGYDVTREQIHQAVNSKLSDNKRLRGGVALVPEIPRTPNGKVKRASCLQLIQELTAKGECF